MSQREEKTSFQSNINCCGEDLEIFRRLCLSSGAPKRFQLIRNYPRSKQSRVLNFKKSLVTVNLLNDMPLSDCFLKNWRQRKWIIDSKEVLNEKNPNCVRINTANCILIIISQLKYLLRQSELILYEGFSFGKKFSVTCGLFYWGVEIAMSWIKITLLVVSLFCYLCRKRHWEAIFSCRLVVSHVFVLILILLTLPNAIFMAFKGLMWIISCFIGEIKWKMLKRLEGSFKNG